MKFVGERTPCFCVQHRGPIITIVIRIVVRNIHDVFLIREEISEIAAIARCAIEEIVTRKIAQNIRIVRA